MFTFRVLLLLLLGHNFAQNYHNVKFVLGLPTTVGSKSTKTARGTCFPAPVSLKKVLKESSPPPMVLSLGIWPSGWIPCSRQYNSQHALPICTPAWPTWTEIHSRCAKKITNKQTSFSCQSNLQTLAEPGQNLQFTYRNLKFLTPLHLEEKRLYLILTHSLNHETKKNHWKNSISVKSKQFKLRKHIKLACICSSKISYPGRSVIILFSS